MINRLILLLFGFVFVTFLATPTLIPGKYSNLNIAPPPGGGMYIGQHVPCASRGSGQTRSCLWPGAPERGAAQPTLIEARKTSLIGLPVKIRSRDYVA